MATDQVLSDAELAALVGALEKSIPSAKHKVTASGLNFCDAWPSAKEVLNIIAAIPAAALIVKIIIAIGDAYSKKHCGK
jgi:hypothetical protein